MEEYKKLKSFGSTFTHALKVYRDHLWSIVTLNLIVSFFSFIASFVISGSTFFGLAGLIIGSLVYLAISLIFSGAARFGVAYALVKKTNAFKSYLLGLKNIFPYLWVFLLMMVIIVSGAIIFIIPGIIALIFFIFAFFVMADEGDKGISALIKSYRYVKDYFWGIALRLLSGGALYVLGLFIVLWLSGTNIYLGFALRVIYGIFAISFLTALNFSLYLDTKHLKPHVATAFVSGKDRSILIVIAIIGCAIIASVGVWTHSHPEIITDNFNQVIQGNY